MSSLNIIKKYPELLELAYLSEREREHDLHAIFKRDIEDNCQFSFRGWRIYPIKTDGEIDMARLFKHLTCEEISMIKWKSMLLSWNNNVATDSIC